MNIHLPVCRLAEKARLDITARAQGRSEAMLENAAEGIPARRISGLPHIRSTAR
jgi:hypothetical protein